jgi:hypothetical protein
VLVFILALQDPAASKNWSRASQLCERTLRSICAQTDPDFRVILVCNTRPETDFAHPHLTIIEREFPIPAATSSARMNDKWSKLKVGLAAARHLAPAHIMFVDADDCVHRGLAEHVTRHPDSIGWSMDVGYLRDEGSRWIYRREDFFRFCGSSAIVRLSTEDFPASELEPSENYFILANGHGAIRQHMIEQGRPLQTLPFVGAVYMTNTGENDSGIRVRGWQGKRHMLEKILAARLLTGRRRSELGLYDLQ